MLNNDKKDHLLAWYRFDEDDNVGKDFSSRGNEAVAKGTREPVIEEISGRKAAVFQGGEFGASYLELPKELLQGVGDETGFSVSTWICPDKAANVWERIYDFGNGQAGPYLFLTRFLRGVCFAGSDIFADANINCATGEWMHIAMTVTGTKGGTRSSAGPRIYLNGELVADGFISQTTSGTYKKLREWLATLEDTDNYSNNFIGHSQFDADADFCGALSDFRIYADALSEEDILGIMCESLSDREILEMARDKFLPAPDKIITGDIMLVESLMEGRVKVEWNCDYPDIISSKGKVTPGQRPIGVFVQATLRSGTDCIAKSFPATVVPPEMAPYELTVHGDKKVLDISKTLYGLFYEDINNAADGGIYAEMINNRSFEEFTYKVYDARSGENGKSSGRIHNPLRFWFGDLDKVKPCMEGGLNEHFHLTDPDANACYIRVQPGTVLSNRGFCDNNLDYSMNFKAGEKYAFSIWLKPESETTVEVTLRDSDENAVSTSASISTDEPGQWKKYKTVLTADKTVMGQIEIAFSGAAGVDMVSLMPCSVWGASEEELSASAHRNFLGNENYRLRRDLVETLVELHPAFLRFPGGCISEGSYIWDNVYDWKDSVGPVEVRKENFNVWGYVMTLGLGYMEYFQLAEDLNAEPLPVMACGVLCQARSDYANPAGGKLQEKYINNFIDLIDFAISTDFENNSWAALRKEMGHEEPFGLHYLGVGNENWGTEFFASFEEFKYAIDEHMKKAYPGYELHIISTVGAQADDDSYQQGWKFLAGYQKGGDTIRFTDGETSTEKEVAWYPHQKNYLETIVDEHYYRSNEYLLENADRYNYYYRPYDNGRLVENQVSKVFVGEYASSDKNTLAGAVAEAAVMTGFEKNSDVVRLAATAPLFNKVVTDGTYRWTPDAIWFDNESVWRTPNYYVQQMFARYIGKKLLATSYETYENGRKKEGIPRGGVSVAAASGEVVLKKLTVTDNLSGDVLFEQDFSEKLSDCLIPIHPDKTSCREDKDGLHITASSTVRHGFYINEPSWTNYTVALIVDKKEAEAEIYVGAGISENGFSSETITMHEYCVGCGTYGTGLKVIKDGKEGYTMGDYSSSIFAGNLRACFDEPVAVGEYRIQVDFGGSDCISCWYAGTDGVKKAEINARLEAYNRDIYHSVTEDENNVYMKLVNAEHFEKRVKINLADLPVEEKAELVTLTGDAELVHRPNVNTKEAELVVPVSSSFEINSVGTRGEQEFELVLPANSVSVVVLNRMKG
jgi:alpha-L-arabinofuranosidase